MTASVNVATVEVTRTTGETRFAVRVGPRAGQAPPLEISNRLLSHFLDHFMKASGLAVSLLSTDWPMSWRFDHVLCEDMGQLVGRGVRALHDDLCERRGLPGRAETTCVMDDAETALSLSIESRPLVRWRVAKRIDIDGFVDAWYDESDAPAGVCYGTNLRQFVDGFALGLGATLVAEVRSGSNLHHAYECIFRGLGDACREALGLGNEGRSPGDQSGLAGAPRYEVRFVENG